MKRIVIWSLLAWLVLPQLYSKSEKEILYIGTANMHNIQGLYVYEYERSTNTFTHLQTIPEVVGPNFLALHPSGGYLYSVNVITGENGKRQDVTNSLRRGVFAWDPRQLCH